MAITHPQQAVVKGPNRIAGLDRVTPETARVITKVAELNGKYTGQYEHLVHKAYKSAAQTSWDEHFAQEEAVANQYAAQDAIVADEAEGKLPGLKRRTNDEGRRKRWLREQRLAAAEDNRRAGFTAEVREMKQAGGLKGSTVAVVNGPMTAEQNRQVREDEVEPSIADAIDAMPTDAQADAADLKDLQKKYRDEIQEWKGVIY